MTNKFTIGAIRVASQDGDVVIPGWHDGVFGVDWRAGYHPFGDCPGGYVVTHLATGFSIVALIDNIEGVEECVAELYTIGDWRLKSRDETEAFITANRERIRELFDRYPQHDPRCLAMPAGDHGRGAAGNA